MPRNGSGIFSLVGTYQAVSGETIEAQQHNDPLEDLAADANVARPIVAGGTGAASAADARTALGCASTAQGALADTAIQPGDARLARTGTVRFTLNATAETGWMLWFDGTIGPTGSLGTVSGPQYQDLFTVLYNDHGTDLFTAAGAATTRAAQGTAAAAWAAGCCISLPFGPGHVIGVAGTSLHGATTRTLGVSVGEETHTLTASEQAGMTLFGSFSGSTTGGVTIKRSPGAATVGYTSSTASLAPLEQGDVAVSGAISGVASGGEGPHNNMQLTTFLNAEIKL